MCQKTQEDGDDDPPGYNGTVSMQGGLGVRKAQWYACSMDHVQPAIKSVTELAHYHAWK
jgi:hypothetical protein